MPTTTGSTTASVSSTSESTARQLADSGNGPRQLSATSQGPSKPQLVQNHWVVPGGASHGSYPTRHSLQATHTSRAATAATAGPG